MPSARPRRGSWIRSGLRLAGAGLLVGAGALAYMVAVSPFGGRESLNLLLLGADQGIGGPARSDTMVVAQIVLKPRFQVRTVAVPRDTLVTIPQHGRNKINAAMAIGDVELARKTVEYNFDLPIDRTLVLTSAATARLVDALGGVTVDVPRRMQYRDRAQNLTIDLKPGVQTLNGAQAVHFLRWRSDGQGDLGRMARQRHFLTRLAREAATPARLVRWPQALDVVQKEVKTDLALRELVFLAGQSGLAGEKALDPRRVQFRLQGPYVRLRPEALRKAFASAEVASRPPDNH